MMGDVVEMDQARRKALEASGAAVGDEPELPLQHGGGGGTLPPMESRVTALETHMQYVHRDLGEIRGDLKTVINRLDALPTKGDLNTWRWQWLATGLAIVALTVGGITGGLALIARFAG